jgi:6-phosphogluconolactonase (cycloisomerase 2 family)
MIRKPGRLALSGIALVCAAILIACSDSTPRLQFVTVAPISGEIYVSGGPGAGVKGALRHAPRPALQQPRGTTGRRSAAIPPPVTATCGSLQYAATALFSDGSTKDASSTATWSSSNTSVAVVSATGLASGIGLGTANIGATFSGVSATSEPLLVDQLNSITVSPSSATVPLGSSAQFTAIGNFTFASGGTSNLDVSSQVTWASSNTAVATVDNTGNATAVSPGGPINITATSCDGLTVGTATLTVGAPAATSLVVTPATITISTGTTTLFTAMEMLSNGTTQPIPPGTVVNWTSSASGVATITPNSTPNSDPNTAVALGVTAASTPITITATESTSGFTGTAALTVRAATARFAFIGNIQGGGALGGGSISVYSVDVTQTTPVTQMTGSPFTANNPQQVLIHPSGDLMYYINASSRIITEIITPSTGSFAPPPLPARLPSTAGSGGANHGVIDPLGRFIYVIDDGSNPASPTPTIYGYSIAQTGSPTTNGVLTGITGLTPYPDPTLTLSSPTWVMTDRAGLYLYVVNSGNNTISEYSITQTGASAGTLTPIGTIPTGSSPFIGTTDVNGHVFVANSGDNTVSVFSIGSNGVLTQVPQTGGSNFTVTGATAVANVLTDPTGKYLYVLDSTTTATPPSHVFAFNLNSATGVIGAQIGTPQLTGNNPVGMAIDPTGALLAVDNNFDSTISLFTVSTSTGAVTPTSPPTVPSDTNPQFVVFYTAASDQ